MEQENDGWLKHAGAHVETKRGLRIPEIEFASALAYYVVFRPETANLPKLVAFRDWLMTEASAR